MGSVPEVLVPWTQPSLGFTDLFVTEEKVARGADVPRAEHQAFQGLTFRTGER